MSSESVRGATDKSPPPRTGCPGSLPSFPFWDVARRANSAGHDLLGGLVAGAAGVVGVPGFVLAVHPSGHLVGIAAIRVLLLPVARHDAVTRRARRLHAATELATKHQRQPMQVPRGVADFPEDQAVPA